MVFLPLSIFKSMRTTLYFRWMVLGLAALQLSCSSDDNIQYLLPEEDNFKIIDNDVASPLISPSGFFIINEDWFGHDMGTVNYFESYAEPRYRVFREANPGQTLGITSTYGTAFGERYYFVSKQGNRLVATDKQLKLKAVQQEIGGDGRAFVGVTADKGYVSTSQGITVVGLDKLDVLGTVEGVSGETGNMVAIQGKVYAVVKGVGLAVIDGETDAIQTWIEGSYTQVTSDGKGIVWAAADTKLVRIDPMVGQTEEFDISEAPIKGQWGAWNPGSLSASMQQSVLYWIADNTGWNGGTRVAKFDTENQVLDTEFYRLGTLETGEQLEFYGAGLRVDPVKDQLVLQVKKAGFGDSFSYNWVRLVSNTGQLLEEIELLGGNEESMSGLGTEHYYWFPSMPFFEDNNAPEILLNQIVLQPDSETTIRLEEVILDQDSPYGAIEKQLVEAGDGELVEVEIQEDILVLHAKNKKGQSTIRLKAFSNGKEVEKEVEVWVR